MDEVEDYGQEVDCEEDDNESEAEEEEDPEEDNSQEGIGSEYAAALFVFKGLIGNSYLDSVRGDEPFLMVHCSIFISKIQTRLWLCPILSLL